MSKIIGNTTATPNPRPDWNQTDATKADFIKNKPKLFSVDDMKKEASGSIVSMNDISPVEHELAVKVKVENENLINNTAPEFWSSEYCTIDEVGANYIIVTGALSDDPYWQPGSAGYTNGGLWVNNPSAIKTEAGEVYSFSYDIEILETLGDFEFPINHNFSLMTEGAIGEIYDFPTDLNEIGTTYHAQGTFRAEDAFSSICLSLNSCKVKISNFMIIKGNYTAETMPPYVDISSVEVKRYGKNLYPPLNDAVTVDGVTATFKNGYVTFTGEVNADAGYARIRCYYEPYKHTIEAGSYAVGYPDDDIMSIVACEDFNDEFIANLRPDKVVTLSRRGYIKGVLFDVYAKHIGKTYPLILKATDTRFKASDEYEPYVEPTTHTPNADGTVDGVRSLYPTTTLITESGALIECEYFTTQLSEDWSAAVNAVVERNAVGLETKTIQLVGTRVLKMASKDDYRRLLMESASDVQQFSVGDEVLIANLPNSNPDISDLGQNRTIVGAKVADISDNIITLDRDLPADIYNYITPWTESGGEGILIPRDSTNKTFECQEILECEASHAEGIGSIAALNGSHAEGYYTEAKGYYSHAEGEISKAFAKNTHAEGYNTQAYGLSAHTEGSKTEAYGHSAHSEGYGSIAVQNMAHAEGYHTEARAIASHSEGYNSIVSDVDYDENTLEVKTDVAHFASHAEGNATIACRNGSHAEGIKTLAKSSGSHAEGRYTVAGAMAAHAEGSETEATGSNSHSEGYFTHAIAQNTHAEGSGTYAEGNNSHAEGFNTRTAEDSAHSEGFNTRALAKASHSQGWNTEAKHQGAHVGGYGTVSSADWQLVSGKNNVDSSDALLIIGNGKSSTNRSNAFEVTNTGAIRLGAASYGTEDIGEGAYLPAGQLYFVYEE